MTAKKRDVDLGLPPPIEALKFRIEQYGWTQGRFATEIGMAESHFSLVMSGKRRLPLDAIRKCVALGIPAQVILQKFPCEKK